MVEENPGVEPADTVGGPVTDPENRKPRPKWLISVAPITAVVVLAGIGVGGFAAWNAHELKSAKTDCYVASESLREAQNSYNALLNGDAAAMAKTDKKQVKDQKTLDSLGKALEVAKPELASCNVDGGSAAYRKAISSLDSNRAWYADHEKKLKSLVDAVSASMLDKSVDDAESLLKSAKGRVADDKTLDALDKAIKARDKDAIGTASRKVDESISVKRKADEDAKAKADADRQAQAQAQAQSDAGYADPGYQDTGTTNTWTGTGGGSWTGGGTGSAAPAPAPTPAPAPAPTPQPQPQAQPQQPAPAPAPTPALTPQPSNPYENDPHWAPITGGQMCFAGDTSGKQAVWVPCS